MRTSVFAVSLRDLASVPTADKEEIKNTLLHVGIFLTFIVAFGSIKKNEVTLGGR